MIAGISEMQTGPKPNQRAVTTRRRFTLVAMASEATGHGADHRWPGRSRQSIELAIESRIAISKKPYRSKHGAIMSDDAVSRNHRRGARADLAATAAIE